MQMLFLMLVVIMYNDTRELIYEVPVDSIGLSAINRIDGDPETMIVALESTREGMYITELGTDLLPVSDFFIRKGRGPGEITFFGGFVVLSDTKVAALDLYLQKVIIYEKQNAAGWAVYKEWIPDPVLGMYPTLMIFHHSELYLIYRDHSGVNEALWVQVNGMDYETGTVRKVGRLIVHEDQRVLRCINRITGNVAEVFRPLEGDRVHAIRRHYVHIVSELDDGSQILKLYRFKDLC